MEFDRQADGSLQAAARAVDRHGHGPRAPHRGAPGTRVELRHRSVPPDPRRKSARSSGKKYSRSMSPDDVSMRVVADHSRIGDVPHRGWRDALERVPRLRSPQDHAPRHAPRHEARHHRDVSATARRRHRARDGRRLSRAPLESRHRRQRGPQRGGAIQRRACGRASPARRRHRSRRGSRPADRLPGDEAFKLYDTFGLPLDFIEDLAGERQVGVDREAFDRAMEGQREKARAKSAFEGKKGQEFVFESDQSQQGLSAAGDRFEGYTTTTVKGTPVIALFDKERRQVKELDARSRRLRGAGADAVLRRGGRPGVRCRLAAR